MDDLPNLVHNSSITTPTSTMDVEEAANCLSPLRSSQSINGFLDRANMSNCENDYSDDSFEEDDDDDDSLSAFTGDDVEMSARVDFAGNQTTECLVCCQETKSPEKMLIHMSKLHNFNLVKACLHYKLDHIMFIKLINFLRRNQSSIEDIKANNFDINLLDDDSYMVPTKPDDAFLRFDIEYELEELQGRDASIPAADSSSSYDDVVKERDQLRELVQKQQRVLKRVGNEMMEQTACGPATAVGERSLEADAVYIDSYSNYDIHHEMLSDRVRTLSYRDALTKNPSIMAGSRVLDLGCGTAILSMFAASGGAKSVDGVEMASIAYDAMDIVRTNNLERVIKVTKGRLEEQKFDYQFDVIVSEWMGYFLLFEGMLDSVIAARDKYLKPGGTMMPNRCTMHICAIDDDDLYTRHPEFWGSVYGFSMKCLRSKWIRQAPTMAINEMVVATDSVPILELDINVCSVADTKFTTAFSLVPLRTTSLNAVCGYFDTFFDLPHPVYFSTGPHAKLTHWKQTVFFLPRPLPVERGIPVSGEITVRRLDSDVRGLEVILKLAGQTHYYTVD